MMTGKIAIEVDTPCGKKAIPVTTDLQEADERSRRGNGYNIYAKVETKNPPDAVDVWKDVKDKDVTVGETRIVEAPTRVYDAKCRNGIPIKIAGKEVGTLSVEPKKSVFVTDDPTACYTDTLVTYGGDLKSYATKLRGKQVYAIEEGPIAYFLSKAPSSVKGSITSTRELVSTACK
jgi:hypothetical protein